MRLTNQIDILHCAYWATKSIFHGSPKPFVVWKFQMVKSNIRTSYCSSEGASSLHDLPPRFVQTYHLTLSNWLGGINQRGIFIFRLAMLSCSNLEFTKIIMILRHRPLRSLSLCAFSSSSSSKIQIFAYSLEKLKPSSN